MFCSKWECQLEMRCLTYLQCLDGFCLCLSLVWFGTKIKEPFLQTDLELVGARSVERARCAKAVLLQPCQVASSRSAARRWSISQVTAHAHLLALCDSFFWSSFCSADIWMHAHSLHLLKYPQWPKVWRRQARTVKPARNDTSQSSRGNRSISFDL